MNLFRAIPRYVSFEADVLRHLEASCTTSDAQALIDAQAYAMSQAFTVDRSPADTAAMLLAFTAPSEVLP
jgi:hypothetical protein